MTLLLLLLLQLLLMELLLLLGCLGEGGGSKDVAAAEMSRVGD